MKPQTILKESNNAIQADKGIRQEHLPIVVKGLKHLRSGDFEVHTEKVEHVEILQAATHWVTVFGASATVQISTYGVLPLFLLSACPPSEELLWREKS